MDVELHTDIEAVVQFEVVFNHDIVELFTEIEEDVELAVEWLDKGS